MKRLFKFILRTIITIFVFLAVVETAFILLKDENGVSHFGNYIPISIEDDSMEPTIMINDLILDIEVPHKEKIKENDVISYLVSTSDKQEIKTGRVVSVNKNNETISWVVKGDNQGEKSQVTVDSNNLVGLFSNTKMLYLGGVLAFLESQNGFLVCIIIPLLLIFFYQLCKLIGTIFKDKKERKEEIEEEEKVEVKQNQENNEVKIEEVKKEPEKIEHELPKEEPIIEPKIEKKAVKESPNELDDSKIDIPIVVDTPVPNFTTPNIESINIENKVEIPNSTNIEETSSRIEPPKQEQIIEPKIEISTEEEDIEIL